MSLEKNKDYQEGLNRQFAIDIGFMSMEEALIKYGNARVDEIIKIVVEMPAFELDENGNPLIRLADLIKAINK